MADMDLTEDSGSEWEADWPSDDNDGWEADWKSDGEDKPRDKQSESDWEQDWDSDGETEVLQPLSKKSKIDGNSKIQETSLNEPSQNK